MTNTIHTRRRFLTNRTCRFRLWLAFGTILGIAGVSGAEPPLWDDLSDTLVATDALGRTVATAETAGPPRRDRTVAMFYFLWHDQLAASDGPFDVSKILAANPQAMQKVSSPPWGPLHAFHHWGESIFGYYLGDDPSVLRKHAQMLSDAGVDLIIFDTSNGPTYLGVSGNELELALPRSVLGISKLPATIDFKWADNIQQTGDASDFTLNGDVAPNDRFNYRARLVEPSPR